MACAALRRQAIDGPFAVMQQRSRVTSVYCLAARRATYGPYRPLLDGPFRWAKNGPSQMISPGDKGRQGNRERDKEMKRHRDREPQKNGNKDADGQEHRHRETETDTDIHGLRQRQGEART